MTDHDATLPAPHVPVMLAEVLEALAPSDGETHVDGTFGAGGYTSAILERAECKVVAIDRDPGAVALGAALVERYAGRLTLVEGRFADMVDLAGRSGIDEVDGVVLDLGVSSMQLDEAERGFSFLRDGPLDMRMDRGAPGDTPSAADVVNREDERRLADILWKLGEEKASRRIARAIVRAREAAPIMRTGELADLVESVLGRRPGRQKIHPATRTFQALRIYVNRELEQLALGLAGAERLLAPGGRLVVVTFHSLEDRIAKTFFAERSGKRARPSRHLPDLAEEGPPASFLLPSGGARTPSRREVEANPRARSARLRCGTRTEAPALPLDLDALRVPMP